jgi:Tfp pilus assembly protein PilN
MLALLLSIAEGAMAVLTRLRTFHGKLICQNCSLLNDGIPMRTAETLFLDRSHITPLEAANALLLGLLEKTSKLKKSVKEKNI